MNAPVKKLPKSVRTLICSSNQINSYKKAVQELVLNALDADATSIAVRIHIAEGFIQVVDNGVGISKADFPFIGINYMTSKFVDISNLKSAPNKYGFQGQSLPSLVQLSETMKVISRFHKFETTFAKTFERGKSKITECSTRPSKGTTVEIKGFLFNLNIRKKSVDAMSELQNIKIFLEHLSLVHTNISLSLRDDSKNEIVYKIHKNRDMYQTLSILYEIDKSNIQELQVEKNLYKVKAFVGKGDVEISKQLIFLNGNPINDASVLHKKVNDDFKKHLRGNKKKMNGNNDEETNVFESNVPFYMIFITCPYLDYERTNTILEFKDWGQVNTILEKVVKFFLGKTKLQPIQKHQILNKNDKKNKETTKNCIEKIMRKILGSRSKKPAVSQMQNGIKGQLIKRKYKNNGITKINSIKHMQNIFKPTLKENVKIEEKKSTDSSSSKLNSTVRNRNKDSTLIRYKKHTINKGAIRKENNICNKTLQKRKHRKKTLNEKQNLNKICLKDKFALATESVKQRCQLLNQKTNELMRNNKSAHINVFTDEKVQYTSCTRFIDGTKNVAIHTKVNEIVIHEYLPLQLKNNSGKQKNSDGQFKSNYDLLQTMINTEMIKESRVNIPQYCVPQTAKFEYENFNENTYAKPYKSTVLDKYGVENINNESDVNVMQEPATNDVNISQRDKEISQLETLNSNILPYLNKSTSSSSPDKYSFQAFTFQSHNYEYEEFYQSNNGVKICNLGRKPRIFITTRSMNNFQSSSIENRIKITKNVFTKPKCKNREGKRCKSKKLLENSESYKVKDKNESYTIDLSKSIENEYPFTNNTNRAINYSPLRTNEEIIEELSMNESLNQCTNLMNPNALYTSINRIETKEHSNLRGKFFEISDSHKDSDTIVLYLSDDIRKNNKTFTIENARSKSLDHVQRCNDNENLSYVFISKSQGDDNNRDIYDPIDVCETTFKDQELTGDIDLEFNTSFNCVPHFDNTLDKIEMKVPNELNDAMNIKFTNGTSTNISFLGDIINIKKSYSNNSNPKATIMRQNTILNPEAIPREQIEMIPVNDVSTYNGNQCVTTMNKENVKEVFNLKNRMCFVPKGMSPIFNKCHTKTIVDYDTNKDYYEDNIYDDFLKKVQHESDVFKPGIRDTSKLSTKTITRTKREYDDYLKFDSQSIKNAKILGQVDNKFIAAIMKSKVHGTKHFDEFLVLFDQHAVHERIRLENNLTDYLVDCQWKSVAIDEVSLKMSRDDILYLHNYKDKFMNFGLKWNVTNENDLSITAIPEGILGKNPRQVHKIIKAVKSLIREEINNIRMQSGCVSLYPKSIMELIFSEACRYAIKFGDHLSKSRCMELLNELSTCKTPFQCAHGRPSMAVIMKIDGIKTDYKINHKKIQRFKDFILEKLL